MKVNSRLVKINAKDIFLIEAMEDYVAVHTPMKRYIVHSSNEFIRVHNSYIVRLGAISEMEDNTIVVSKKIIPVSRSHRKNLINHLKLL